MVAHDTAKEALNNTYSGEELGCPGEGVQGW